MIDTHPSVQLRPLVEIHVIYVAHEKKAYGEVDIYDVFSIGH